jgi:hypothetical protein
MLLSTKVSDVYGDVQRRLLQYQQGKETGTEQQQDTKAAPAQATKSDEPEKATTDVCIHACFCANTVPWYLILI